MPPIRCPLHSLPQKVSTGPTYGDVTLHRGQSMPCLPSPTCACGLVMLRPMVTPSVSCNPASASHRLCDLARIPPPLCVGAVWCLWHSAGHRGGQLSALTWCPGQHTVFVMSKSMLRSLLRIWRTSQGRLFWSVADTLPNHGDCSSHLRAEQEACWAGSQGRPPDSGLGSLPTQCPGKTLSDTLTG